MTKQEAKARLHGSAPTEFKDSRDLWAMEDFIDIIYDDWGCVIEEREVKEDEVHNR